MTEQKQGKHEGEQNVQNGCYNRNGNGITVKDPIIWFVYKRWENLQRNNSTNTINFELSLRQLWMITGMDVWYKFCDNPAKFRQLQSSQADMIQLQL